MQFIKAVDKWGVESSESIGASCAFIGSRRNNDRGYIKQVGGNKGPCAGISSKLKGSRSGAGCFGAEEQVCDCPDYWNL
jgi:hypothetical protein